MFTLRQATNAYAVAATFRSIREQEADVFRRTNAMLRRARDAGGRQRVRALADNNMLWDTVIGLMLDPDNALPAELRATIVSVGLAVQRQVQAPEPDFDFLLSVNENIAAGLSGPT